MIVVGINAFHADASAVLLRDGILIAAVEEERFTRVKHWTGFPAQSLRWCLRQAGITLGDIDHLAINQNNWANLSGKLRYVLLHGPRPALLIDRLRNRRSRAGLPDLIGKAFPGETFRGKVHAVEHHLAHLASAFYVSPFRDAAVLSIDGFGDFASAAWGVGADTGIRIDGRVNFPHSLGTFYQAMTQYLGFPRYGDEYKVMGLAPYGAPRHLDAMRRIVRTGADGLYALDLTYFRHQCAPVSGRAGDGAPEYADLFSPALEELLGPRRAPEEPLEPRHHDIARSAQEMYEEALFNLLNVIQRRTGLPQLALAGGCAMNSVANGRIRRMTGFGEVYVQAAAGDAGGALGAAFAVWHGLGDVRQFKMNHAAWGPAFGDAQIAQELALSDAALRDAGCAIDDKCDEENLCRRVAGAIADGLVVGWFQGRAEWGPRALGNRSILGDPRRADMKAILNDRIKRRESFRPFAPSILAEHVSEWFEDAAAVPFMAQVLPIKPEKRALIPAVCHVDGSGRLQTVSRDANARFHRLIDTFYRLTGVPMLLNTSFNESEPIVRTPREAIDCFLRTKMDVLVLGGVVVERARVAATLK